MIRFDKLTLKAQEAIQSAQEIAARHDHQQIEPLHLLGALVAQQDGIVLGSAPIRWPRRSRRGSGACPK
jgi:ATP-dependent Clp protease ATP-binding subunit ClpA